MPRVLRILNRLSVGGPVLNAVYLTHYMAPEFETLLVVGEKEDHEESAKYMTEQFAIKPLYVPEMGRAINAGSDYKSYKKLKQIINEFKPDIVHTHAAKPGALGRLAASALKVPVILHTYHGHVFHSYFSKFKTGVYLNVERFLAKKSDALIAISPLQKYELVNEFKVASEDKFHVIPLGLELDKFQTDYGNKREKFRKEFNLCEQDIAIGIIGRLVPVKNHDLFLEAISYLLKNTSKPIRAFIIGDGETRSDLESKARSIGLKYSTAKEISDDTSIIFTSWRSDIDVINAGLDIVTLTSLNEGTPVSLIEAQAAHKPIVSTKVGGIQDIVMDGENAFLSDIDDKESFFKNLYRMVEDDDLRKAINTGSKNNVIQKYSYQRLVKDMSALYNQLLEKQNSTSV